MVTDLSKYNNNEYHPGSNAIVRIIWYFVNIIFFINPLNPISSLKVTLLKLFGAKIGRNVNIKPSVNIKYPWRLTIGDYSWIGEKVWIDNLADVVIGSNCCISQGAMLLTGSHDYTRPTFNVQTKAIVLENGAWIGAKSVVFMGVCCKSHSILGINSVAIRDLEAYSIYYGIPAIKISERTIVNQQ